MEDTQQSQIHITGQEGKEANIDPEDHTNMMINQPEVNPPHKSYIWWLKVALLSIFVLAGQTAATVLGRLYFDKGGNSKWMSTFVQPAGFPVLLPFYLLSSFRSTTTSKSPSSSVLASVYVTFGLFLASNCFLYSVGLSYLPVSTYSLICASQLGFNALFSFFINSQKFTPFIVNSLVLLTISSTLIVSNSGDDDNDGDSNKSKHVSKGKYVIGFICTLGASAGYGLMLSVTQFAFKRVLKQENYKVVLDLIIYPSVIATIAVLVGLFASGEWRDLRGEMVGFELGKVSYIMTLFWTAIAWQVFNIGCLGLIFEVSSLFSNVISTLGLPIVPVLAVFIFHDKMNGIKVVAMVLAIWGFVSYMYQHYLDDYKVKPMSSNASEEASQATPIHDKKLTLH